MKHGAVRKLTRAAALSFLVLATTSSVAGLEVLAAGSAMAEPGGQGGGSDQGATQPDQNQPPSNGGGGGGGLLPGGLVPGGVL